jgi:hypothetical protein
MDQLVANLFEQERKTRRFRLGALAALAHYRNTAKFCRHWFRLQHHGQAHAHFVRVTAAALGIEQRELASLIEVQRRQCLAEWNRQHNEPFQPRIDVVAFMALFHQEDLPVGIGYQQAEQYAHRLALEFKRFVFLHWSSRLAVKFDGTGRLVRRTWASPEDGVPLYMRKKSLPFLLDERRFWKAPEQSQQQKKELRNRIRKT